MKQVSLGKTLELFLQTIYQFMFTVIHIFVIS